MNPTKIVRSTGVPLGWMRLDVGASKLLSAFAVQASVHTNPNRTRTVPYARYFRLKDIGSLITYSSKPSAVNKARQESPASWRIRRPINRQDLPDHRLGGLGGIWSCSQVIHNLRKCEMRPGTHRPCIRIGIDIGLWATRAAKTADHRGVRA